MVSLGQRIAREREARGFTQRDLAAELGVSPGAVAAWEVGRVAPTMERRADLARLLRISIADLVPEMHGIGPTDDLRAQGRLEINLLQSVRELPPAQQEAILTAALCLAEAEKLRLAAERQTMPIQKAVRRRG